MTEKQVKVASLQCDPDIGNAAGNVALLEHLLAEAASTGAQLIVAPECSVQGYTYGSLDEALAVAEPVPGPSSRALERTVQRLGVYAVVGLLEAGGEVVYNTAIFLGPDGFIARYRKSHLLCLGVDRFTTPGNIPFVVHDTPLGRIGILICYDLRFPEPARVLALQGAEIIALPTNWPAGADIQPDVLTRARAAENHVFVVAADRVGSERGASFIGRSQIVAPFGRVLAEGSGTETEIITAEIEPARAANKHIVIRPGEYEMSYFEDRRPEMYEPITAPTRPTAEVLAWLDS